MNERIRALRGQIAALEEELRIAVHAGEQRAAYRIEGKRVAFEESVRCAHRRLKTGFIDWMFKERPLNLLTGPVIYSMIVPLLLLDLCVSVYQAVCFPVYRIARVRRAGYFNYDRSQLGYLNFIERFHCAYCTYANGLLAYATEIVARTEQYFCPIKHAQRQHGVHARYDDFLEFGDASDYHTRLESIRQTLERKET